ncbi:MAG TPA: hypothetical protein VNM92_17510 [Thermoanaerobaculia bacterium]|nr:hypothetical protein [Thermoanaerobaculia bacterium]
MAHRFPVPLSSVSSVIFQLLPTATAETFVSLMIRVVLTSGVFFGLGAVLLWYFFKSLGEEGDGTDARARRRPIYRLIFLVTGIVSLMLILVILARRG